MRSFFFFGTFFFLCGEIEFLGKMGITLSRQKTASDCSFESVVLCRFKKSTYIRKKYTRLLPHRLRHNKKGRLLPSFFCYGEVAGRAPTRYVGYISRAARERRHYFIVLSIFFCPFAVRRIPPSYIKIARLCRPFCYGEDVACRLFEVSDKMSFFTT